MWCRLIAGEEAGGVKAVAWRQAASGVPAVETGNTPQRLYVETAGAAPQADANSEAARLRDTEKRIAEAHQRGFQEGEAAASRRLTGQVEAKLDQLGRSIEQLAMHRAKIQREAEPELVRLSLAIGRRILRRELSVDPEALQGLLKVGLEKIEASEIHRVRANPEHAVVLRKMLEGAARRVEVAADPGLPVGAVIFETSRGSVDTGMETQLKEIERGFADLYPR
jgi:flagellar assembly protein FliH